MSLTPSQIEEVYMLSKLGQPFYFILASNYSHYNNSVRKWQFALYKSEVYEYYLDDNPGDSCWMNTDYDYNDISRLLTSGVLACKWQDLQLLSIEKDARVPNIDSYAYT